MRSSSLFVLLLVLHIHLLRGAYGSRLGKFALKPASYDDAQPTNLENENALKKSDDDHSNNNVDKKEILSMDEEVNCKDGEDHCSSKGTLKRRVIKEYSNNYHHHRHHHHHHHHHPHHQNQWFSWIHEDYRGPYRHRPRHH